MVREGQTVSAKGGRPLKPDDATTPAELGHRCALLGRWGEAVPRLEGACATDPSQPGSYRIPAAVELGRRNEPATTVATILELDPDRADEPVADIESRNVAPELIGSIVASLAAAKPPASTCPERRRGSCPDARN